jgi:polyadenylate-binding protein
VTWQDVKDLMRKIGTANSVNIEQTDDKESGNICTLYFNSIDNTQKAIEMYDNTMIGDRKISLEMGAEEKKITKKPVLSQNTDSELTSSRIMVENINSRTSWQDLKDYLSSTGIKVRTVTVKPTENVYKLSNSTKTNPINSAVVIFDSVKDATQAMADFNHTKLRYNTLVMRYDLLQDQPREVMLETPKEASISPNTSKKIFVYNLASDLHWSVLKDHCRLLGDVVQVELPTDVSGKSKGFGFVTFATLEQANLALAQIHGTLLNGRPVHVREMHESRSFNEQTDTKLFIASVPSGVSWQDLKDLIADTLGYAVGRVLLRAAPDGVKQQGLVEFKTFADAQFACRKLQGLHIGDKPLIVKHYDERWRKGGKGNSTDTN